MPQQINIANGYGDDSGSSGVGGGNDSAGTAAPDNRKRKPVSARTVVLLCILLALLGLIFGFTTNFIPSNSMEPTLMPGDHILTMRRWLAYPFGSSPRHGDIVVFKLLTSRVTDADYALGITPDDDPGAPKVQVLIKRVVAVGGDKIRIKDNKVFLNDVELHEDHSVTLIDNPAAEVYVYADNEDYKVPKGQVFLLGDNRNTSEDSRFWGPLDTRDIMGKFVRVLYNEGKNGLNEHRDPDRTPGQ